MLPEQAAENDTAESHPTEESSNEEATSLDINMPEPSDLTSPKIGVFGIGGAGCNSINNLIGKNDLNEVGFVACNTDRQSLLDSKAGIKICLGAEDLGGLGAGKDARVGFEATRRSMPEIMEALAPFDMVFITAGMGGGTGTGGACVIAKVAKSMGKLVVAIVSRPFHFERQFNLNLAQEGICALSEHVNALIVLENQQLQSLGNEQCTLADNFKMFDDFTHNSISTVIDIVFSKGLINLDYNDVRSVLLSGGFATIVSGYASGANKIEQVVKEVTTNRLLDHNIRLQDASSVLISATTGPDISFADTQSLFTKIPAKLKISEDVSIFYCGVNERTDFKDTVRVSVIAGGVKIDNINAYKPIADLVSALHSIEVPTDGEWQTGDLFQKVNAKKALSDASNLEATRESLVYRTPDITQEQTKESPASNESTAGEPSTTVTQPQEQVSTFADDRMEQIHQDLNVVNQKVQQQFLSESRTMQPEPVSLASDTSDSLPHEERVQERPQEREQQRLLPENPELPSSLLAQMPAHHEEVPSTLQAPIAEGNYTPRRPIVASDEESIPNKIKQKVADWINKGNETPQQNFLKEEKSHHTETPIKESQRSSTAYPDNVLSLSTPPPALSEDRNDEDEWINPAPVDLPPSLQRNLKQSRNEEENYENPSISVMKKQAQ